MFRKFTILFAAIITSAALSAQEGPKIKFDQINPNTGQIEYRFGEILEAEGKKTGKFTFTNVGDEPLVIKKVKPGCGCTASNWTKSAVKPGETGFISATYDPKNRPGKFHKAIYVTTNEKTNNQKILMIHGNVIPRPKTYKDTFRTHMGNLWVHKNSIAHNELYKTEAKWDTIKFYNNWDKDMTIKVKNPPKHLTCVLSKTVLKPGERGYLAVKYDASNKVGFGLFNGERLYLQTNDTIQKLKTVYITVYVKEDFRDMTPAQLENAPNIKFLNPVHDFGTAVPGERVKHEYYFTNTGNDTLIIRRVQASCGCTGTMLGKKEIAPGDTSKIAINFNTRGRKGKQYKTITVISNDPDHSSIVLQLKGTLVNTPKPEQTQVPQNPNQGNVPSNPDEDKPANNKTTAPTPATAKPAKKK